MCGGRALLHCGAWLAAIDSCTASLSLSPSVAHPGKDLRGRSGQPALADEDAAYNGSRQCRRVQERLHASQVCFKSVGLRQRRPWAVALVVTHADGDTGRLVTDGGGGQP